MAELVPGIRNAVRAVIIRDGALLVQHKTYQQGWVRYALPGGAPDLGETLAEGLRRECQEEIGTSVEIGELMYVADYYKPRETMPPTKRQQVEFLFRCHVSKDYVAQNGPHPDKHQIDVIWLPLAEVNQSPLYPPGLKDILLMELQSPPKRRALPVYLGLIK